jgi:hypothetical protein
MKGRQKVVFGFAVLTSGIFCVALAMGKFSPPPKEIATPIQTQVIAFATNVTIDVKPRVIHRRSEESALEEWERLATSCVDGNVDLIDMTSPLPTINFR